MINQTKFVVKHLAATGVGTAVVSIIHNNRNHSENQIIETYHDASTLVGGAAAGFLAQDVIGAYTDKKIDDAALWWNTTFPNHPVT